jgi:D-alanyl-D-alanine carboxypeptidase (penicillin-binding protein 5/6)
MHILFKRLITSVTLLVLSSFGSQVLAQQIIIPAPPQLAASSYLLIDAATGEVLVEKNANEPLPPASLTKIMSSYIFSGEVERAHIGMQDMVPISVRAWKMGGSRMFIREGTEVSVEDLLRGVIIQSGNDATVALAEYIAGSEEAFVDIMNQQAALLGMTNTQFKNSTGWPAEGHFTTAWDLSLLARALINDHPVHYAIYAEKEFTYGAPGEEPKTQSNRNKLLFRDKSVDGIKTGHTNEAGYCLVSSAVRGDMRLISVVMGTRSENARADESQKLLAHGFRYYETHNQYVSNEVLASTRVWGGQDNQLNLVVNESVSMTIPRGAGKNIKAEITVDETIKAPIEQNQALGEVVLMLDGEELMRHELVAEKAVAEAGFFARIWDSLKLFFVNLFSS